MRVRHRILGPGTVRSVSQAQGVVTVEFADNNLQNLVIKLAILRPASHVFGKDSWKVV